MNTKEYVSNSLFVPTPGTTRRFLILLWRRGTTTRYSSYKGLTMLDLPPSVPPQFFPVVIAQASQAQKGDAKSYRTIGVCHLIQNPPIPPLTAVNSINPVRVVWYSDLIQQTRPAGTIDDAVKMAKVTVLQGPERGELKVEDGVYYRYHPVADYYGHDRTTLLVEIGGLKVKVMYFFNIGSSSWGGTEGYDPYLDKKNCPKGPEWKISLDTNRAITTGSTRPASPAREPER